jgi:hypothetical protein
VTRSRNARARRRAVLERRYQRLLAWYPATYRARYADEMIGVALAAASPDQRRPGPREAVSLIASGLRIRFRLQLAALRSPAWRDAAGAFVILGPIVLAAIYAVSLPPAIYPVSLAPPLAWGPFGDQPTGMSLAAGTVFAVGWGLVAVAAVLRWRWAAAAGASLGATAEAVHAAARYGSDPSFLVVSWWQLMLAVMTALAAVTLLADEKRKSPYLSWRVIGAVAGCAALLVAASAIEPVFTTITPLPGGGFAESNPLFGLQGGLRDGLFVLLAAMLLVAAARLNRPARRRFVALWVPALVAAAITSWWFGGFLASSPRFVHPVLLTAPQWAALGLLPVLGFAAGLVLVIRHERVLRSSSTVGGEAF